MKYSFLYFFTLFIFFNCNNVKKQESSLTTNVAELDNKVSIIEYFEIDTTNNYLNNKIRHCTEDMSDSQLKIKFSTIGTLYQSNKFLNLSYKNGNWNAIIGSKPLLIGESEYTKKIEPKCGWKIFEDSLVAIDIKSMKIYDVEQKRIESSILDGRTMIIEIITSNEYKVYEFKNPDYLISQYIESVSLKKFNRLYNLINDNFENHYKRFK